MSFCFSRYDSLDKLAAVASDGRNINTGRIGGTIRLSEEDLQRPLQWLVCLLHANELPLRHLLTHLDGIISGPKSFSGSIGKQLASCQNLPTVAFSAIEVYLPDMTDVVLSIDQQYLNDMCKAIKNGVCSLELSRKGPGTLSHAQWLTAANRLLRLYVSTLNPSDNLVTPVTYILKVYAPMWFLIKSKSSCKDGARHAWQTIHNSHYLSPELRAVIDPVIQRNAYFSHPENILIRMLSDNRKNISELAMRRIQIRAVWTQSLQYSKAEF